MKIVSPAVVFLSILIAGCQNIVAVKDKPKQEIIISAAASLKEVMAEIQPLYQQSPQVAITYNFAASGTLQRQIEQGAPVDIFISADRAKINILNKKGLLKSETVQNLLQNKMVLISSKNLNNIKGFLDLPKEEIKIVALGEPNSVPAGKYAQEVLNYFKIAQQVKAKAVYGKDVRQVLNYVATGNATVGIVYLTDALINSNNVKIIAIAPRESHSTINYAIAVTQDSRNAQIAQEFIEFLKTSEVQKIFTQYGFIPVSNN